MTPIRRVDNVDLLQHIVLDRLVVTDIVPRTDLSVIRRILIRYRCWIDDPRTVGTMRSNSCCTATSVKNASDDRDRRAQARIPPRSAVAEANPILACARVF